MKSFLLFFLTALTAGAGLLDRPAPNLASSNSYHGSFRGNLAGSSNAVLTMGPLYDRFDRADTTPGSIDSMGVATSGHTYTLRGQAFTGTPTSQITNGTWANPAGASGSADYASFSLDQHIFSIGGKMRWTTNNPSALTNRSLFAFAVGPVPLTNNASLTNMLHCFVTRQYAIVEIWTNFVSDKQQLMSHIFRKELEATNGTLEFSISVEGQRATVVLPDGNVQILEHPDFRKVTGRHGFFELIGGGSEPGDAIAVTEVWAGAQPSTGGTSTNLSLPTLALGGRADIVGGTYALQVGSRTDRVPRNGFAAFLASDGVDGGSALAWRVGVGYGGSYPYHFSIQQTLRAAALVLDWNDDEAHFESNIHTKGFIVATNQVVASRYLVTSTGGTNRPVDWTSQTNVYDDIIFPLALLDPPGAVKPGEHVWTSGRDGDKEALRFEATEQFHVTGQMPHWWVPETTVYPHLHVEPQTTNAITNTWAIYYTTADIGSAFPTNTVVTNTVVIPAGQWTHRLVGLPTNGIPMTGRTGPSTFIRARYVLLATSEATDVLQFDIHARQGGAPVVYNP